MDGNDHCQNHRTKRSTPLQTAVPHKNTNDVEFSIFVGKKLDF